MRISRNVANEPKSNNWVLVGIWIIVCIQKPTHHFLQTFRPLRMCEIVFGDSSLYPKHLSLFCLLWLVSANFAKTLVWKTWIRRQIMTSQKTDIKYKWHHTPWMNPPWKFSAYATVRKRCVRKRVCSGTAYFAQQQQAKDSKRQKMHGYTIWLNLALQLNLCQLFLQLSHNVWCLCASTATLEHIFDNQKHFFRQPTEPGA